MNLPQSPIPETVQRPLRDVRLDIVRGFLQVTIVASHVGGFISIWLIHAAWGYSDSSEQFVLLSGLMLGSVFAWKRQRLGFAAASRDMLQRVARLWVTRLIAIAAFGAMLIALDLTVQPGAAAPYRYDFLSHAPVQAALLAAGLLYNPAYLDVLVVFIVGMMALPGFDWAAQRIGPWALLPSALLWLAVQIWHLPSLDAAPDNLPAFNVWAWQVLFLIGAWFGRRKLLTGRALPHGQWVTWLAGTLVLLGVALRVNEYGLLHLGLPTYVVDGRDKAELSWARLLHALALAVLVARITPMNAGWMQRWPLTVLAAIGRHSLHVYCIGLFLSYAATRTLDLARADSAWLEPVLIAVAVALLGVYARWQDGVRPSLSRLPPFVRMQRPLL